MLDGTASEAKARCQMVIEPIRRNLERQGLSPVFCPSVCQCARRAAVSPAMCRLRLLPILLAVLILALRGRAAAEALDPVLQLDGVWTMQQDDFQTATRGLPFRWNSTARDSARASGKALTLLGLPLSELVARFANDKVTQMTAVIYARGDAGEIQREAFEALLRQSIGALDTFTKVKFTARGKDATSAVKADGVYWKTPRSHYLLEYSFTKEMKSRDVPFRAEFIRLEISPPQNTTSLLSTATNAPKMKFSGGLRLQRDEKKGDVWIAGVPMVDQGEKGYCVVASAERVMRFYGSEVDQNELAQIANTGDRGTSPRAMSEALKKLSQRLRIRVRDLEGPDVRELLKMQTEYNRAAKKANAPAIPDMGNVIDVGLMYQTMKAEVLKEVRTRNRADVNKFLREVQVEIDKGVPLMWSVQLGLFPEPGVPQSGGGHMRLIIGYNAKTQEILFSDSWGAGHELKRMPLDIAWTITTGLLTIEPL